MMFQVIPDKLTVFSTSIVVPVEGAGLIEGTASIDGVPLLVISWTDTLIAISSAGVQLGTYTLLVVCENGSDTVNLQILNNNKRHAGFRFGFGF